MHRWIAITCIAFVSLAWTGVAPAAEEKPGALTDAQKQAIGDEIGALKVWISSTAEQYGDVHPAVFTLSDRVKALEAAVAANRIPPPPPEPDAKQPAPSDLDRSNMESEAEILRLWFDGMQRGYGKDHPAIAFVRARLKVIDALLAKPAK